MIEAIHVIRKRATDCLINANGVKRITELKTIVKISDC